MKCLQKGTLYLILQLVQLSLRRRPPPDLDMIDNGFVLTESEAREKMIKARIINRMSKRVVIYPQVPCEEEYLVRCRKEASNILLGVRKNELIERFIHILQMLCTRHTFGKIPIDKR